MCDCKSYNGDFGTVPEVVIPAPSWLRVSETKRARGVCVDACIVHAVQHLWNCGVCTRSSCCGHGQRLPSLVLEDESSAQHAIRVRALLAEVDSREWELLAWHKTLEWELRRL